jgi:hypothetical protein
MTFDMQKAKEDLSLANPMRFFSVPGQTQTFANKWPDFTAMQRVCKTHMHAALDRIEDLEKALIEERAERNYGPQWKVTGAEKLKDEFRKGARGQLVKEGLL